MGVDDIFQTERGQIEMYSGLQGTFIFYSHQNIMLFFRSFVVRRNSIIDWPIVSMSWIYDF